MKYLTYTLVFLTALLFSACGDSAFSPIGEEPPANSPINFGLVKVTISGIGTEQMSADAKPAGSNVAYSLTQPAGSDGSIQLEPLSNGSFTTGTRGVDGMRYIYATFKVRNADAAGTPYGDARRNITFLAVDTDASYGVNETYGVTAVSKLRLFDGAELTGTPAHTIAEAAIPTGRVTMGIYNNITPVYADVLQVFTEAEAGAVAEPTGVEVFPYGFITRSPHTTPGSRELPANPATNRFDGRVTFAFKLPLQAQANQDPFEISVMFLPVDDSQTRVTQSLEEQTADGKQQTAARAGALNADYVTIFPGSTYQGPARLLCGPVRVNGAQAAPTAVLFPEAPEFTFLDPDPYAADGSAGHIAATQFFIARFSSPVNAALANPSTFVVRGQQSGLQFIGKSYTGVIGTDIVTASADFFPGELVEISLTTGLGICPPRVARYRVAATSGSGTFSGSTIAVGSNPVRITAGDWDGDGDLDLAVTNYGTDNVSLLANDGSGTFTGTTVPAGDTPEAITAGDWDGDGDLDLAVTNVSDDNVSLLANDGLGIFTRTTAPAGDAPEGITAGDWDGDGDLDLAVANRLANTISLLANNGSGGFTETTVPGGNAPYAVTAGDWDGDGDLDLAVTNVLDNTISLLANNGSDGFTGTAVSVGDTPYTVTAGDWDGDGDLDLAVANRSDDNVSLLTNDGSGTFTETAAPVGNGPRAITAGDWDGNGDLDLAVANISSENVSLLANDGSGGFTGTTVPVGNNPRGITAGDWDGDGDLDLAVPNVYDNTVSILINQ